MSKSKKRPSKKTAPRKRAKTTATKKKRGAPPLGLGQRFSIALFAAQDKQLQAKARRTNRDRVDIVREHFKKYPIR